jgi:amino acid adenylation domain-containing protein
VTSDIDTVVAQASGRPQAALSTLVELWDERVRLSPHAMAVLAGGESVSFAEVDRRAGALAGVLRSRGVGPESLVGVCVGRSVELVVGVLGVLKAGGAFVPLDAGYPVERLRFMMADSGVELVVVDAVGASLPIFDDGVRAVPVTVDSPVDGVVAAGVQPENLAYVIYTSGSTGRPKGVAVRHGGIAANIVDMNERFALGVGDRVLGLSAVSFDMSVYELVGVLIGGGAIVLPEQDAERDPARWLELVTEHRVTVWHSVPARVDLLVDEIERARLGTRSSIRTVLSGGDRLTPRLPSRVWKVLGEHVRVANIGGVTEASVYSNHHDVTVADTKGMHIPYGRAMAGQTLYVVDDSGQLVPPGVVGELWIGGIGLARGYANRKGMTAERFVADPFGKPGERAYRTGDLARWRDDGAVELLGRADHQVKVRGFRIELGEIEVALRAHPLVDDCVVAVRSARPGGDELAAYVVPDGAVPADFAARLRTHLSDRLPTHMIPQGYAVIPALPLSPNGKVDRKTLLEVECERVRDTEGRSAPASPREELILAVWRDLIGVADITPHDDFFELGGQSLLAMKSVSRLREALGVPVELRTIFESPTAAALARAVSGVDPAADTPVEPGAEPVLSFGQERIWIYEQLGTGIQAYNVPVALTFRGGVWDVAVLRRCIHDIVRRHEVLRSAVVVQDGKARPVVRPVPDIEIPVVDVRDELDEVIRAEVDEPFDFADGLLIRGVVLRTAERDVFLVTMHHIACDGWSVGLLMRELGLLYEAFSSGRRSPLPEAELQYADFAAWQRSWLRGEVLKAQLAYWRAQLAGLSALELPVEAARPAVATFAGDRVLFRLPDELAAGLRALCRDRGVTLFMGLLAGFQVLLSRYSAQSDVTVGTLVGGRPRPETENLIGYFVNTLVLRTDLSGDPTWTELLERVRMVALSAYAHQDVPFERLVEELHPDRDLSRNPLFQVLFALHEPEPAGLVDDAMSRRRLEGMLRAARFDLAVDVTDMRDAIEVSVEFATDLFDRSTVERMSQHFVRVLEQLVVTPGGRLSTVQLLSAQERLRVVSEGNPPVPATDPAGSTLVSLWDRQVSSSPEGVAVVAGSERVSFREVDRRADALARQLRSRGVGPESAVGVCVGRSAGLVVGLLGVLKAGAAFVPLDAGYPAERLRYMVGNSGVELVVDSAGEGLSIFGDGVDAVPVEAPDTGAGIALPRPDPRNLAYIIYTSGSTGAPKGVAITHANITSFLAWNQRVCQLTPRDRALLNHSLAFDNSVWEIFQCLVSGAELHIVGAETAYDPETFRHELERRGITTLNATPSQLRILLDAADDAERDLASVRLIFTGAEAVPHGIAHRILAAAQPDCQVFNEYGPTEATITSATCPITRDLLELHAGRPSVPFGWATDNARLYVLDEYLWPVVPGCRGSLYIGGDAVGRGYVKAPGRTATRYVPDPYAGTPGARMYSTGDLVQLAPDGNLVFLGRDDHQVKVRGYRIELGEIETALCGNPLVSECVAAVRQDGPTGDQLVAYVVPEGTAPDDLAARLREHLTNRLPAHMIPRVYAVIDAIPLTRNGKVDRKALPSPQRAATGASIRPPGTAMEKLVARTWQESLTLEGEIGLDDNFFDAGGNSLTVTTVAAKLSVELRRRVSPVLMFRFPTVAGLAACLDRARDSVDGGLDQAATGMDIRRERLSRMRSQRRTT